MFSKRPLLSVAFCLTLFGCGGAGAEPAKEPAPAEPSASEPPSEPQPEPSTDAKGDKDSGGDKAEEPAGTAPDQTPREVTYTQSAEGLKVDVSGVRFLATATPVRVGDGWGVKVKVSASVTDKSSHKLLSPKNGPLAFAGKVDRAGKVEQLGDERAGDDEKALTEKGIEFTREWPGKTGAKPLTAGQTLELQVGLWGVGADSLSLRPLRQFCLVKMVAGKQKPQAVVSPPSSAASEE